MTADLSHFSSAFPSLMEAIAIASSLTVIFIDWNHNLRERSQLRFLQSYLPQWRSQSTRQGSYTCLVILALAIIYNNSMKNFAINLQNCLFAGASLVVLLSFWLQSKIKILNTSDKSVGGSPVILRDQGISASTCCGARVPQFLLSLPTSSVPQCEVNIEEEMKEPYVLAFRSQFDLEEVSNEKLATAIRYLNTLRGGKSYLVQVVIQLICQINRHIICYLSELQNYQCFQNKYLKKNYVKRILWLLIWLISILYVWFKICTT